MKQTISFGIQQQVQLRFLCPNDIPEIKLLCNDWFPIEYPHSWYEEITSNPKFFSLAATLSNHIIGMIVCEVKPRMRCNREDADILASTFPSHYQVAYILSLGVVHNFRRNGIASLLLDNLLNFLVTTDHQNCKAVYLHVLTTNSNAIRFYEKMHFKQHNFLPYYYSIQGSPKDGYCYVLYINGGYPPWNIVDAMHQFSAFTAKVCTLPMRVVNSFHNVWIYLIGGTNANRTMNRIRYS